MAYHSPITANDRAVNSSIDSFNSGLTYSGSEDDSVYTKGDVAMQAMPAMMQLGKVMKLRGELNEFTRRGNAAYAQDAMNQDDEKAFGGFTQAVMDRKNLDPVTRNEELTNLVSQNGDMMSSKRVSDAMKMLSDTDDYTTNASTNRLTRSTNAIKQQVIDENPDRYKKELEDSSNLAAIEAADKLNKAKQFEIAEPGNRQSAYNSLLHSTGLPQNTLNDLSEMGTLIGYDKEHSGKMSWVTNIATSLVNASSLAQASDSYLALKAPKAAIIVKAIGDDPKAMEDYVAKNVPLAEQAEYRKEIQSSEGALTKRREAMTANKSLVDYMSGDTLKNLNAALRKANEPGGNSTDADVLLGQLALKASGVAGITQGYNRDSDQLRAALKDARAEDGEERKDVAQQQRDQIIANQEKAALDRQSKEQYDLINDKATANHKQTIASDPWYGAKDASGNLLQFVGKDKKSGKPLFERLVASGKDSNGETIYKPDGDDTAVLDQKATKDEQDYRLEQGLKKARKEYLEYRAVDQAALPVIPLPSTQGAGAVPAAPANASSGGSGIPPKIKTTPSLRTINP